MKFPEGSQMISILGIYKKEELNENEQLFIPTMFIDARNKSSNS